MPEVSRKIKPGSITLDRGRHLLRVEWEDGHPVSEFPLNALREACPCAVCRGGHEFMGPEHDPDLIMLRPVRTYRVAAIQLVGNYALQIVWDDNHDAGIYSWDYLRRICPCSECAESRRLAQEER